MYPFCREVRNIKSKTYEEFVEKFKPKKTTDDCYTPSEIYEVIKDWVCKRYNIDPENVIRPFWPGGDYEKDEYPPGCVVVDNPPFSILKIYVNFIWNGASRSFCLPRHSRHYPARLPGTE